MSLKNCLFALAASSGVAATHAAEVHYTLDPTHTFPSFEADHFGISTWRGKMNHTTGEVMLNRSAKSGTINLSVELNSIDFGLDALNSWAIGKDFFEADKYPKATFTGHFSEFKGDVPTRIDGQLTLHGVTHPLSLSLTRFACMPHPMLKREWCGADAIAMLQRDQFGLAAGKDYGMKMAVDLRIQVEALRDEVKPAS